MRQALYREWRPLAWDAVVGQEHVVRTLHNAVKAERISHAYLFSGPRGTGASKNLWRTGPATSAGPASRSMRGVIWTS